MIQEVYVINLILLCAIAFIIFQTFQALGQLAAY